MQGLLQQQVDGFEKSCRLNMGQLVGKGLDGAATMSGHVLEVSVLGVIVNKEPHAYLCIPDWSASAYSGAHGL